MSLATLNAAFEADPAACELPATLWDEWLWSSDLHEAVSVDCLLNRAHLLGLLIARYKAVREPRLAQICVSIPRMVYTGAHVSSMTARQLQDTMQDLQMHWESYLGECDSDALIEMVDACMVRFGQLCLHPSVYDDVGMRDSACADRMSVLCIRRFVSIFCVLYHHLDLMHRAVEPCEEDADVESIMDFHVQASMEEFYRHMMHSHLPPAARLISGYRQDFAGFYHCVSQVVYFHFPSYERKPQLDLSALRRHPVHALAPLREMYPEIALCYEDETLCRWSWVLMGQRVYLTSADRQEVFHSANGDLIPLVQVFLKRRGGR